MLNNHYSLKLIQPIHKFYGNKQKIAHMLRYRRNEFSQKLKQLSTFNIIVRHKAQKQSNS